MENNTEAVVAKEEPVKENVEDNKEDPVKENVENNKEDPAKEEEEDDSEFLNFLVFHHQQLLLSNVPEHFWRPLFNKLKGEVFDAFETFTIVQIEIDWNCKDQKKKRNGKTSRTPFYLSKVYVRCNDGVSKEDGKHIYLIDHAWTYSARKAKRRLLKDVTLFERMSRLMAVDPESKYELDEVLNEMWRFNQTYSVPSHQNFEDRLPVWYIMDEFGSAIQHSDTPNFRIIPFAYAQHGISYSIMFPVEDVAQGDEVTRDFIDGCTDKARRKALLIPWAYSDFKSISFIQTEPAPSYFTTGHLNETIPDVNAPLVKPLKTKRVLKVFSEYPYINYYLTDRRFQIVDNDEEADILWYTSHFTDYERLSLENPEKYINQFPYEFVITVKDLLSIVCRRACKTAKRYDEQTLDLFPSWLPATFNLNTELDKFISYFQRREDKRFDNHWICKPWNLARGLDTHITNKIHFIARLPTSGPKIAQKYLHDPVLFHRKDIEDGSSLVKFDIRYVLLLKSVSPLEVYVYRKFFLRFSNKSFGLNDFEDYQKHFTVMNYNDKSKLHRMLCVDFVKKFEKQNRPCKWDDVESKIFQMFSEMFEAAVAKEPPSGIGHSPQSRALYAADIMLTHSSKRDSIEPQLLEVNWMPDCERACAYYKDFYNDIFALLFLDEVNDDEFCML